MHPAGDFGWYVLMLGQNRAIQCYTVHSYEIISGKLEKGMFLLFLLTFIVFKQQGPIPFAHGIFDDVERIAVGLSPKTCLILVNCIECTHCAQNLLNKWANMTTTLGPAPKDFRWSRREKEEAQCGAGKWKTCDDAGLPTEGVASRRLQCSGRKLHLVLFMLEHA